MIRSYRRSANEIDVRAMTGGRGSPLSNLLVVSLPVSLVIGTVAFAVSKSLIVAAGVAAVLFISSAVSNARFFGKVRSRQTTLDGDAVEILEVQASRVVDVEALGSHGPAWIFFVGDGKALLLIGQWLLEAKSFPSASFLLHLWADSRRPIRIESLSSEVEPEHSAARLPAGYRGGDVEVFDAAVETLPQDLLRAFGRA